MQGGDVEERHVAEKRRLGDQRLLTLARGVGVLLLDQVPLVHQDDQAGALLPGLGGDAEILVVQAHGRVHDEHRDLSPLDRAFGPQRGVELQIIFYFSSAA